MITFTKEQLIASACARIEFAEMMLAGELEPLKERTWSIELELARIALASLEAEAVHQVYDESGGWFDVDSSDAAGEVEDGNPIRVLYTAPPALVVPVLKVDWQENEFSAGWNACHAATLQGADGTLTNEGTITATQFKPVADLYGLTSPTGGETSFTFDAVEARDFIDGGWSCQEYVELGRFQEAVSGNSPVIPGCSCLTCRPLTFSDSRFVVCPECGNKRCPHANDHRNACTGSNEPGQEGSAYPAAPQKEDL